MAVPLCLLPGLLRDLCAVKSPSVLLFPSKNQKVDVQSGNELRCQKELHGAMGERMLYAFIFTCMS